ncbi:MAG TPA: TonB-dependent receptor plug domain-containing protein, partial [Opitutus sp.]|nr:TonB-dependent receptor plug domain-containing protein [Opitutus sp.]
MTLLCIAPAVAQQTNPPKPAAEAAPPADEILILSPFEVTADNSRGYYAANTMSGTRLNTRLEDLASAMSVVTKEQMQDFGLLDINDIFAYETSTEGTANFTDFVIDRRGNVVDNISDNPQGANRIRGIGAANTAFGNFQTSGRAPIDPSMLESVEISRGPNSNIFGLGNAAGTVNLVPATANLFRDRAETQMRADSYDGYRGSLDVNRVLKKGVLAVRGSAVFQRDGFERKPSGTDTRRYNGMVKFQPFKSTTLRAGYYHYDQNGTRANSITPRDAVSYWRDSGAPSWDPSTFTVKKNGSVVGTYPVNTTLPDYFLQSTYVNHSQLFIDQEGLELWSVGQTSANDSANSPSTSIR